MDAKERRLRNYSETFGWVVRTVYEIAEEAGWCEPDDLNVFNAKQLVELRAWLRAEGYGPVAAVLDDRWKDLRELQETARTETVHEVLLEDRQMRRICKAPQTCRDIPEYVAEVGTCEARTTAQSRITWLPAGLRPRRAAARCRGWSCPSPRRAGRRARSGRW